MPRHPALLTAAVALATAGLVACASPTPAAGPGATGDGPVVAFYGDSYTLGTGASDPSLRWSTRISESRGWVEVNPSVNGLGFINNRERFGEGDLPSMIIQADPDIVFVTMGLNDNFSFPFAADAIEAQIDADLRRLTEALPEARFIVVEPFWYTSERPPSVPIIIDWVRDAAERYGADYIPDASTWIQGREGEMAADGLHPNDEGYAEMARLMDAALLELGL
ncbi:MAG: SGNH/GDSL hydrolase family protein [Microcella sp.]|uniref:SGNH/GDSL hydrolase family protein n=1 Tax=Microcella sp. TaxID=1913979 RepID=UPI003314C392